MKLVSALCLGVLASVKCASALSITSDSAIASLTNLVVQSLSSQPLKYSAALDESKKDEFLQIFDDLYKLNKGFNSDLLEGTWVSALEVADKPSTRKEKAVTFLGGELKTKVATLTPHGNGIINSIMSYKPVGQGHNVDSAGKIVLRRVAFGKNKSNMKYKSLPRLPVPFFKRKSEWLDFLYMDENICITRDNKGVTYVHMREYFLDKALEDGSLAVPYAARARLAYEATDKSVPFADFKVECEAKAVNEVKAKRNDIAVEYDAAAINAFMASNRKMSFDLFKEQYKADARAAVAAKQNLSVPYDAAAMLAYTKSDRSVPFEEFKAKYEEEAIAEVTSKQKVLQAVN